MKRPDYIPADYDGIKVVGDLTAFFAESFGPANVILYPRSLTTHFNIKAAGADFGALAVKLGGEFFGEDTTHYRSMKGDALASVFKYLDMTESESIAAKIIEDDIETLISMKRDALMGKSVRHEFRILGHTGYSRTGSGVELYHDDGHPNVLGRVMCCYTEPTTEGLRKQDVVKVPYGYELAKGAVPFSFKVGDIWRHAGGRCADVEQGFIHRALPLQEGQPPRMLFILD